VVADAALYPHGVLRPQAATAQRELARGRRQAGTVLQVHAGGERGRMPEAEDEWADEESAE